MSLLVLHYKPGAYFNAKHKKFKVQDLAEQFVKERANEGRICEIYQLAQVIQGDTNDTEVSDTVLS